MRFSKITTTVVVIVLCVLAVRLAKPVFGPHNIVSTHLKANSERTKGDPSAPLWIVEYIDFQCNSCRFASQMIRRIMAEHPSQIYLQVHYFPLGGHPHGMESALWVECARQQGKFWEFAELIYDKQEDWSLIPDIRIAFTSYAKQVGLDQRDLDICMADRETEEHITAEKEEAKKLGVSATPTFFVNGNMLVGPGPLEDYLKGYFTEKK